MKYVRQIVNDLRQKRFIGREKELETMLNYLDDDAESWQMLHLHGPGGIGKTALMHAYQRAARDREILYMDRRSFLEPAQFLQAIRDYLSGLGFGCRRERSGEEPGTPEADALNSAAVSRGGIVLLLDQMDGWGTFESWLWDRWLPLLTVRVKACSGGRRPLDIGLLSASTWSGMFRNLRLLPLNRREMDSYAIACGIADPELRYSIERFSGGIPLALSLVCETVLKHGAASFLAGEQTQAIIASMDLALFRDGDPIQDKRLLAAASLVWRFDQDLLESILDEQIPQQTFNDFCQLPYIKLFRQGGYCLLDAVRNWMNAELSHRAPETHALFKKRALAALERRWKKTDPRDEERKRLLRLEKSFLAADDFMKSFYFATDGSGFVIRAARQEHVTLLSELIQQFFLGFPPFLNDDTLQHTLLDKIWEAEPSSFRAVYHEDQVAGVYTFVPLNEKTRPTFANNRVYAEYIRRTPLQEREFLIWILGVRREYEPELSSIIVQDHLSRGLTGNRVTILVPIEGPLESLCRIGFERMPWADYQPTVGLHWKAACIDLLKDDFFHRIPVTHGTKSVPVAERTREQLAKQLLERYHSLARESAMLDTIGGLFPGIHPEKWNETLAEHMKKRIDATIEKLSGGKSQQRAQARILQLFYIDGIGSHEIVASRLALAMTTYYRYLKKGITRLAEELFD